MKDERRSGMSKWLSQYTKVDYGDKFNYRKKGGTIKGLNEWKNLNWKRIRIKNEK
jgi:hypothetical protein